MDITGKNHWSFYLEWGFLGIISFLITFPVSWILSVFVLDKIVGEMILVGGELRVTEDNVMAYAFIPFFGIVVGVIQYLLLRQKLAKMGWWILTATLGWSLAWLVIGLRYNPLGNIELPSSTEYSLIVGAILGITMGFTQWLLLRGKLPHAVWWIPANLLGFGLAGVIFGNIDTVLDAIVAITIPFITTGIVLWLLFEKLHFNNNMNSSPPNPTST